MKTSPSKKRRAVTHGPLKKTAGSAPLLTTQTSNKSLQLSLQHQVSSESRDDTEGDISKTGGKDKYGSFNCSIGYKFFSLLTGEVQSCELLLSQVLKLFPLFLLSHTGRSP